MDDINIYSKINKIFIYIDNDLWKYINILSYNYIYIRDFSQNDIKYYNISDTLTIYKYNKYLSIKKNINIMYKIHRNNIFPFSISNLISNHDIIKSLPHHLSFSPINNHFTFSCFINFIDIFDVLFIFFNNLYIIHKRKHIFMKFINKINYSIITLQNSID